MIKLILVMLLGWIGFTFFKKIINPKESNKVSSDSGQKMVACGVCSTHIPESEAITRIKDVDDEGKFMNLCSERCVIKYGKYILSKMN